jgi:hypothetical protein
VEFSLRRRFIATRKSSSETVYSWQEFESSRPSKNDGVEKERFSPQDETLFQADLVVKMKHSAR